MENNATNLPGSILRKQKNSLSNSSFVSDNSNGSDEGIDDLIERLATSDSEYLPSDEGDHSISSSDASLTNSESTELSNVRERIIW